MLPELTVSVPPSMFKSPEVAAEFPVNETVPPLTVNVPASGAEFTVAVTAALLPVVHEPSVAST